MSPLAAEPCKAVSGPGREKLAETEGFEPSIELYNPITV